MTETEEKALSGNKYMTLSWQEKGEQFALLLLQWFEKNKREFPWRPAKSPYQSAIAEILLQKTSATNARPIYELFIRSYPTVYDLAIAEPADLAQLLRPLGIPRRAILIKQLAMEIITKYGGEFPDTEERLRALPVLGPYGAGAVASQAFNRRAPMIDINVMRVFGRVF